MHWSSWYGYWVRDPLPWGCMLADCSCFKATTFVSTRYFDIMSGRPYVCPVTLSTWRDFLIVGSRDYNPDGRMHRIECLELSGDRCQNSTSGRMTTCINITKDSSVC